MSKYRFNSVDHIHELDGKPLKGTTSIIKEVYPPPLAWYGSAKAVELLGYVTEKKEPDASKRALLLQDGFETVQAIIEKGDIAEYGKFVETCYKNHNTYMKERGKAGKDEHTLIENYINECLKNGGTVMEISDCPTPKFMKWAQQNVQRFLWCESHCYSEKLWVGGITDWGAVMKNGKVFVGDNKPSVYHSHFIQCAGYAIQINENGTFDAEGNALGGFDEIQGYCIYDYVKGEAHYLAGEWTKLLQDDFAYTCKMHDRLELKGQLTLE